MIDKIHLYTNNNEISNLSNWNKYIAKSIKFNKKGEIK